MPVMHCINSFISLASQIVVIICCLVPTNFISFMVFHLMVSLVLYRV